MQENISKEQMNNIKDTERRLSHCMYFSTFNELCVYACISFALNKEIGFSDCT